MERPHKGQSLLIAADDYICLDLETTGVSPYSCSIIEIGAVKVVDGKEVDRYTQLIDPQCALNPFITNLTGITNAMLDGQPTAERVLPDFFQWVGRDALIVGHNVNFDVNFLYDHGMRVMGTPFANDFVDTMRISRTLYPRERHHRLLDLIQRFDIADTEEHRALSDALQTVECYEYMKSALMQRAA